MNDLTQDLEFPRPSLFDQLDGRGTGEPDQGLTLRMRPPMFRPATATQRRISWLGLVAMALRRWLFRPAMRHGVPVAASQVLTFRFAR